MTNYNERLDDVLSAVYLAGTENGLGRSLTDTKEIMHRKEAFIKGNRVSDEAKQAITSLTKELVAEAKPYRETIIDKWNKDRADEVKATNAAMNAWADIFEQNLLKGLEEDE